MKCARCKKKIDNKNDKWVNVRDFNKGEVEGELNLHLFCWKNMQKEKVEKVLREKLNQVSNLFGGMLKNFKIE